MDRLDRDRLGGERRSSHRYDLHFALHYRVAQKGALVRFGSGTTCEMSATGLSFRSRKPLPIGAHIEMIIDWPANHGDSYPIGLQVTGFVVRNDGGRTCVRLTSRKFRAEAVSAVPMGATA